MNWKILVNQWRNEPSPRYQLGHHPAFTKSAQEPDYGAGRTLYCEPAAQLGLNLKDTVGELRRAVNFTPSTASLNPEEPGTSRADTLALGLKWVRQQYPSFFENTHK